MDTLLVAKAVMPQSAGSAGDAVAGASDAGTADAGSQFGQLLSTQLKAMHAADAGVSVGQSVAAIVSDDSRQSADSANAALLSALTAQLSGEASDAAQIATQPSDKPQSTEVAQLPDASLAVDAANLVGAPSVPTDAVRPSAGDVASQAVRRSRHDATSDTAEQAVRPAVEPSADTLSATNAKKQQAALSDAAQSAVPSQADAESPGAGASLELLLASTIARPRGSPEQSAANGGKKLPGADKSGAEDAKKTVADTSEVKDAPAVDAQAMAQAAAAMQAASVPVKSEPVAGAFKGDAPAAQSSAGLPGAVADRLRAIPAETSLAQAAESAKPESPASSSAGNAPQTPFGAVLADRMNTPVASSPQSTTLDVSQRVDSAQWGQGMGEKVVWMVGSQTQGASLHLNPPALGPLEVRVRMVDNQATLTFVTQHAQVREAIEAATPRLREMLGDSGISLGGVSVNVGSFSQQQPGDQQASSHQEQFRQNASSSAAWADAQGGLNGGDAGTVLPVVTSVRSLRDGGMVDLFA